MSLLFHCILLGLTLSSFCFASPPTNEEMTSWLNKNPDEIIKYQANDQDVIFSRGGWDVFPKNIKFDSLGFREIKEIFLTNKERAYLVPIVLDNRGRNSMNQIALVLPTQQKVIPLLDTIIKEVNDVYDLNSDHISEVVTSGYASGQGTEESIKAIVHIMENGTINILHEATIESNEGMYGENSARYSEKDIKWEFIDVDNNGVKMLKESIIISKGREHKSPLVTTTIKFYKFLNNIFELQEKKK